MGRTRRFVLGTLALGGALAVGWSLLPPRQRLTGREPLPAAPGEAPLNGWVKIARDGGVVVAMARSEMGQGVHTALALLLAEELDADWSRVRTENSPIDPIYNNLASVVDGLPFHPDEHGRAKRLAEWMAAKAMREFGVMMTGGSSSVKDLWLPMRQAGASARAMLVAAAAEAWQVPAGEIRVAGGRLEHASGRGAHFGEMAEAAARRPLPRDPPLKDPSQFRLVGRPMPRLGAPGLLRGDAGFGIDVVLPGMRYASVRMCPTLLGRVKSFDDRAARALPGVQQVLAVDGHFGGTAGVACIADTPFHALEGVAAVEVAWDAGPLAGLSSDQVMQQLATRLDTDDGWAYFETGDVDAALAASARVVQAEYHAPYLAHTGLEPMNCTVQFRDGRATVWAPTQVPGLARRAAAQVLGIDETAVDLRVQRLGGGFGRRLDVDFVGQAAAIAKAAGGAPVQTFWTRAEDLRHDFYRPACASRFRAGLDAQGRVVAWRNSSAGQAIVPQVLARLFGLPAVGPDKTTAEGAYDQPYEFPAARIGHAVVGLPVPVGFWRAVGHSHQAFFKESFMDELAHAAGADPVDFRAALLARHPRHLRVLRRAAALAGWGQAPGSAPDGAPQARGIALHQSFGAVVAQVAEVSVAADKSIRVHRVVCVVDCGFPLNPNGIRQQMDSGIVFGLSAALSGEITIADGQVRQGNFHDAPVLRMDQCPVIETEIIASTAHPEGVGEPGLPPVAPAVANAVFALTGQRLRSLPLRLS